MGRGGRTEAKGWGVLASAWCRRAQLPAFPDGRARLPIAPAAAPKGLPPSSRRWVPFQGVAAAAAEETGLPRRSSRRWMGSRAHWLVQSFPHPWRRRPRLASWHPIRQSGIVSLERRDLGLACRGDVSRPVPLSGLWTLEHVVFPALRSCLRPSKARATDGSIVQVAALEKLYRIFERC